MPICKRAEGCSFFNNSMKEMPATAERYKKRFCFENYFDCARHYLFTYLEKRDFDVGDDKETLISKLADTLYPNQLEKVKKDLPD